ncbi:MAG: large conductance mechanosensitive channel protein MscL [Anaerolineae bacterium]
MWQDFKKFIARGNVIELAIAVVIGGAFSRIVTSLVNDIIMPPLGLLLQGVDFANLFINLSGGDYETLAAAQEAGAATINYGLFINTVISFILVAFVIFLISRQINKLHKKPEAPAPPPATKECPYCFTKIPIKATRCPNCTTYLEEDTKSDT